MTFPIDSSVEHFAESENPQQRGNPDYTNGLVFLGEFFAEPGKEQLE